MYNQKSILDMKNTRSRYIVYGKTFLTWKIVDL